MMNITEETSVRDIAVEYPAAIPVLERLGIDYCCGGKHTLAEACSKQAVNLGTVLDELQDKQRNRSEARSQWQNVALAEIAAYIVQKHHAFTREQIKVVGDLMRKVEARHGAGHPEISALSKVFAVISSELTHHFFCEENILFPFIGKMEAGEKTTLPPISPAWSNPSHV